MVRALTPIAIGNLKPRAHRFEVSDGGCQGLRVCVFPSGKKSFLVRYRFRGLQRKLTLGPCLTHRDVAEPVTTPELGTPLSLAAARAMCTEALRQAKSGNDPVAAKRQKREQERAAEGETLQAISEEFLRREGGKLRTLDQRRSDLELLYKPLGRLPVEQIRRGQYFRVLDHIADERGDARADRVLTALKRLLAWHAERSEFVSPLGRGGRRTSIKERARSHVLSDAELRQLWLTAERDEGPFGSFLRFLLCTCTRRGEAAGLRRSELSDDGTMWTIPASRYKSKRDTLIPLSEAAQRIIAEQPVLGDFVFSADGSHALGGFANRKREFDEASGTSGWRLHDLRRTSRTLLSRCGVNADTAERCLGHALVGVRATYDKHTFEPEMRAAFEALASLVERIVAGPSPVVADFVAARARRRP